MNKKNQSKQSEQGIVQISNHRKFTYLVNQDKKDLKDYGKNHVISEQKLSLPLRERGEKAYVDHLRKMSKKSGNKKISSIPYLNYLNQGRKFIKIEHEIPKVKGLSI